MRDFNVDALDHEINQKLWNILEGYDLVVSGPTRHGGLLDHVYLLKSFMGRKRVALLIKVSQVSCEQKNIVQIS